MIIKKHLLLTRNQSKKFMVKLTGTDLHTDVEAYAASEKSFVASSTGFKYFRPSIGYFSRWNIVVTSLNISSFLC